MTKKALRGKKKLMYEALKAKLGVVTAAAKRIKIDRTTHYLWLKKDENYKRWIDELPDITLDFVESALLKQIKKGNITSIIFFLKTKGKKRGYIERTEVEYLGEPLNIKVNIPEEVKKLFEQKDL